MLLLNEEFEVLTSNENKIILTNQRIFLEDKRFSRTYKIFIFLEDISSTQVLSTSQLLWLVLSILSAIICIGSISSGYETNFYPGVSGTCAVVFLISWLLSKTKTISIHPNGGKPLLISVNKMDSVQVDHFIDQIQYQKNERFTQNLYLNRKVIQ